MDLFHLSRALARSETKTGSSRIWTRMADSIFYDDNRFSKDASSPHWSLLNLTIHDNGFIENSYLFYKQC